MKLSFCYKKIKFPKESFHCDAIEEPFCISKEPFKSVMVYILLYMSALNVYPNLLA